jgi:hypothetical protein
MGKVLQKRVNVSLSEGDYELVQAAALAMDCSMSEVLRDYVEISRPMLRHIGDLGKRLTNAKEERQDVHKAAMVDAMGEAERVFAEAQGQLTILEVLRETVLDAFGDPRSSNHGGQNGEKG